MSDFGLSAFELFEYVLAFASGLILPVAVLVVIVTRAVDE